MENSIWNFVWDSFDIDGKMYLLLLSFFDLNFVLEGMLDEEIGFITFDSDFLENDVFFRGDKTHKVVSVLLEVAHAPNFNIVIFMHQLFAL